MKQNTEQEVTTEVEEIKFAKPEDVVQLVSFGYKSFDENGLSNHGVEPNFEKTILNVTDYVINGVTLVKRNEEDDKLVDGVIMMHTSETWWSRQPVLFASLFYIKPEKRSYKLASSLLKAAKEYAIMTDIPLVIDLIGNKDIEKKKILFKRAGFQELGSLYVFKP